VEIILFLSVDYSDRASMSLHTIHEGPFTDGIYFDKPYSCR